MKTLRLVPVAAIAAILTSGCQRKSPDVASQVAELERKANEAVERQRELEQQLADQKLAAERDAIERERMKIEEDRLEMERQQGDAAAAEAERIRQREDELAGREGKLELLQSELQDKQGDLERRDEELSERDRELAGREALTNERDEPEADQASDAPTGDYGMFYESLAPYGSWFETPDYGYVWQPVIVRDASWRPYTRGRWACTDRGWTWMSDEPYGWATYHYGRWALCRGRGWVWVPGSEWAPSWVCWRSGGTHVGWAPLPPETLAYRGHHWDASVETTFGISALWFNFVEVRNFGSPIHHHCLPYTQNHIYIGDTSNITHIHVKNRHVICGGPFYGDIARQTDRRPPFYRIEEDRHGSLGKDSVGMRHRVVGNRLCVAAPNLDVVWNDALRPATVKGRMETMDVERQQPLRPEVTERFRQVREAGRKIAEDSIRQSGGNEQFRLRRLEELAENRRVAEKRPSLPGQTRIAENRPPARNGGTAEVDAEKSKVTQPKAPDLATQRARASEQARQVEHAQRLEEEMRRKNDNVRVLPRRVDPGVTSSREVTPGVSSPRSLEIEPGAQARSTEHAQRLEEEMRRRNDNVRVLPKRVDPGSSPSRVTPPRALETDPGNQTRSTQHAQRLEEEMRRKNDNVRVLPRNETPQQRPNDSAAAQRVEADRIRQQQAGEMQQREIARQQQQQAEQQRQREQSRQQQQEQESQRQREQARQQQQQAEQQRQREQARQQQQEQESQRQREQARQQQQEQESQRQREQARQQQQEQERQQERQRQSREEEERGRGRNR